MRPPVKFIAKAPHHLYTGLITILFSGVLYFYGWLCEPYSLYDPVTNIFYTLGKIGIGIGIFIAIDDIIEHTVTADTPLRIFGEKILAPFLRSLKK